MFYDPRTEKHGLKHSPVTALVVPRPIGWITTLNKEGVVNLGPYSFFNLVSGYPPWVIFSSAPRKHSQTNAEATGEFVFNLATWDLREEMSPRRSDSRWCRRATSSRRA
jgi:flavin reductase (DIM6/NTAB) family NADH-FMN oxidoreductase RutF